MPMRVLILAISFLYVGVLSVRGFKLNYAISSNRIMLKYENKIISPSVLKSTSVDCGDTSSSKWSNPDFDASQLNSWWVELGKALLTIGSAGVQQSHINSLSDLLSSHERVRVKLASDKINARSAAEEFLKSSTLIDKIVLLEVRKQGFMVGRKVKI